MDAKAVADLKARAQRKLEEAQRQLEAIEVVERMLAEDSGAVMSVSASSQPAVPALSLASPKEEDTPDTTVIDSVSQCFDASPSKRWTVAEIEAALRLKGFRFQAQKPSKSIHTAIFKLVKRGSITVVRSGKGRIPSLYSKASRDQESPHSLAHDSTVFAINRENTKL